MKTTHIVSVAVIMACLALPVAAQDQQDQTVEVQVQDQPVLELQVIASDYKFSPSEFAVQPGQKIRLTLVNKGKRNHNIEFELPGQKLKLTNDLKPGESGTLEFTAPAPGTFSFKCPVDLHSTLGMSGKMVVQQPGK